MALPFFRSKPPVTTDEFIVALRDIIEAYLNATEGEWFPMDTSYGESTPLLEAQLKAFGRVRAPTAYRAVAGDFSRVALSLASSQKSFLDAGNDLLKRNAAGSQRNMGYGYRLLSNSREFGTALVRDLGKLSPDDPVRTEFAKRGLEVGKAD